MIQLPTEGYPQKKGDSFPSKARSECSTPMRPSLLFDCIWSRPVRDIVKHVNYFDIHFLQMPRWWEVLPPGLLHFNLSSPGSPRGWPSGTWSSWSLASSIPYEQLPPEAIPGRDQPLKSLLCRLICGHTFILSSFTSFSSGPTPNPCHSLQFLFNCYLTPLYTHL